MDSSRSDKYGNTLSYIPKSGAFTMKVHGKDRVNNIGKLLVKREVFTYFKHEKEADRLRKHNAWTVLNFALQKCARVAYQTEKALYTIDASKALSLGFKLESGEAFNRGLGMKWVVPIEHWETTVIGKEVTPLYKQMSPTWAEKLDAEFKEEYFQELRSFIANERKERTVYPKQEDVFKAFRLTSFEEVKVVIVGEEPYAHSRASGLAYSCEDAGAPSSSLAKVLQEVNDDIFPGQFPLSTNPDLTRWARQGVLLLNMNLTVNGGTLQSHRNMGWETFMVHVIQKLRKRTGIVYMLWGNEAQALIPYINAEHNLILSAEDALSLSGCRHFSSANRFLQKQNLSTVLW